jgi:hypothetical protein
MCDRSATARDRSPPRRRSRRTRSRTSSTRWCGFLRRSCPTIYSAGAGRGTNSPLRMSVSHASAGEPRLQATCGLGLRPFGACRTPSTKATPACTSGRRCAIRPGRIQRHRLPEDEEVTKHCELLDDGRLLTQLRTLERRVRPGGRDVVGHPPHGGDDRCNAAVGALLLAGRNGTRRRAALLESPRVAVSRA